MSYIVLEGGDGCGKSLQARRLVEVCRARGQTVRHLREPGSTPTGEALRQLLLDPATGELAPLTEALLFSAARVEMLRREVAPAVAAGETVVVERSYLSTEVYQGRAAGVPAGVLKTLAAAVHDGLWPDRILVLDVDAATAAARVAGAGAADRIEARGSGFHAAVRQGYLELAALEPRAVVIDATAAPDQVFAAVLRAIADLPEGGR